MAKASFNIQQASRNAFFHNAREAVVTYTIDDKSRNQIDRSAKEAIDYYLQLLREATENYTARTGQKIQTKEEKFLWEAVVNLNENHTLQDVQKLAEKLQEKFGWQPVQIAIHRDEGHIDKTGKKIYNYHAHIVFFMLSKDGIYRFKKRDFGKKKMAEIQTLTAKMLGMERGVDKRISGRERLEHRQFKQLKKKEEELIEELEQKEKEKQVMGLTVKALKGQIEAYRKELIEKNKQLKLYTKEDYKALSELKKLAKRDNVKEIFEEFLNLQKRLREKEIELRMEIERRMKVEQENRELKRKVEELEQRIKELEEELKKRMNMHERQKKRKELKTLKKKRSSFDIDF